MVVTNGASRVPLFEITIRTYGHNFVFAVIPESPRLTGGERREGTYLESIILSRPSSVWTIKRRGLSCHPNTNICIIYTSKKGVVRRRHTTIFGGWQGRFMTR